MPERRTGIAVSGSLGLVRLSTAYAKNFAIAYGTEIKLFPLRFSPRLTEHLKHYDAGKFTADLAAGVTVGVVALPLAMAFAIASGLKPEAGIYTAIVAGFLVSALGGSSVQIGGPAGAFIVIVYGIVERYGVANLLLATSI